MSEGRRIPRTTFDAIRAGKITRRRACSVKHRFSFARALRVKARREAETGVRLTVYHCPFCNHHHLAKERGHGR